MCYIWFYLDEQLSLKKQQLRNDRRNTEDTSHTAEVVNILADDSKRTRRDDDEEPCSRML